MPFNVFKSSAGSGKTYTLVKAYLKLLLANPGNYKHILAITFTNRAANEMKERIITYLTDLSSSEADRNSVALKYLLPDILDETKLSEQLVRERAGKALELILHDYSNFAIGTIDSFVHRIVRTFAYDLHLPLNFEVELDSDVFIQQAVDILISRIGSEKELTEVLVNFVMARIDEEKSWHIERELQSMSTNLLDEEGQLFIEKLKQLSLHDFIEVDKKITSFIKSFQKKIQKKAAEATHLINQNGIEPGDFYQGKRGVYKYFNDFAEGRYTNIRPGSYTRKTIEEDKWFSAKIPEIQKKAIESVKADIHNIYSEIQGIIDKDFSKYSISSVIQKNLYALAVLNEIEKLIIEIKEQRNIVHISEFNRRIAEIVLNEPVPFIYERLGEKYRYFLIDEFQDTSVLQWHNLLPLIDNSLAAEYFNLVVGDAKQAIYRWRNGDFEQFVHLPSIRRNDDDLILAERENSLKRNYQESFLQCNFRSRAEIIEFNNNFFEYVSGLIPTRLMETYKNHEQEFDKNNTGGYVKVDLLEKADTQSFHEENLLKVHDYISEIMDQGYKLSDIAVLCRSNKEASSVANFLIEKGLSVISPESLLLGSSDRLNFIMAIVKYLLNPDDKISQAHALNYLWQSAHIKTPYLSDLMLQLNKKDAPVDLFSDPLNDNSFSNILKESGFILNVGYLKQLSVYDLCEELIRVFNLNDSNDPYLEFFLDAVHQYSIAYNPDIFELNDWWEEKKNNLSVVASDKNEAIQVMTIHKAKGLAFTVVIYPFADQRLNAAKKSLWIDLKGNEAGKLPVANFKVSQELLNTDYANAYEEEMELSFLDMVNLLYVVMTRPVKQLYIITKRAKLGDEFKSIPQIINGFLQNEGLLSDERSGYEFGRITQNDQTKTPLEELKSTPLISERWQNKVLLSMVAPRIWDTEHPQTSVEYGNLIHSILSQVDTADDIEFVLTDFLHKGMLPEKEYPAIKEKVIEVVDHPELKLFFSKEAKVRSEADVLAPDGKIIRPDRFVVIGDTAFIIDYKTGKEEEKHKQQLISYNRIISQMGYSQIRNVLVYIDKEIKVVNF